MIQIDDGLRKLIVSRIVPVVHPEKIILFGSRARGTARLDSDIDLLVIARSEQPRYRRAAPIYGVLSATCLVNQAYVLQFLNNNQFIQSSDPVALTVTLINLAAFIYVLVLMWDELKDRSWLRTSPIKIGRSDKAEAKENEN